MPAIFFSGVLCSFCLKKEHRMPANFPAAFRAANLLVGSLPGSNSALSSFCRFPRISADSPEFPDKRKQAEGKDFPCQNSRTKGSRLGEGTFLAKIPGQKEEG